MKYTFSVLALPLVALLTACGGGGSSSSYTAPAAAPPASATFSSTGSGTIAPAASGVALPTETFGSYSVFVSSATAASARVVYVFDNDTANTSVCATTSGCSAIWPPLTVPAGTTVSAPFGTTASGQLTLSGRPLYTYISDSTDTTAIGNGSNDFAPSGATGTAAEVWHAMTTSGPAPDPGSASTSVPPPISGY